MTLENTTYHDAESLRNSDAISTHTSLTSDIIEQLITMLTEKGIDWTPENPLDITREELDNLANDLESSPNTQNAILRRFAYRELLESKWYEWVTTEVLTNWLEWAQEEIANKINEISERLILDYTFIPNELKWIVQLWILKNILNWIIVNSNDALGEFKNGLNGLFDWNSSITDIIHALNSSNFAQSEFIHGKMSEYKEAFDTINNYFETSGINDHEQQRNIIAHSEWFRSPEKIASEVFNINSLNPDKAGIPFNFNEISKNDELLHSMMSTRAMIESLWNMQESRNIDLQEMVYWLLSGPHTWDLVKSVLESVLRIPFLWQLIAWILGLSWQNAIEELNENSRNYKLMSALKNLWATKDENWNINADSWEDPFKWIDLSEIKFNDLKDELRRLRPIIWNIWEDKYRELWEKWFSDEWYEVTLEWSETKKLKFSFNENDHAPNNVVSGDTMKEIISDWIRAFNTTLEEGRERIAAETEASATTEAPADDTPAATADDTRSQAFWDIADNLGNWRI